MNRIDVVHPSGNPPAYSDQPYSEGPTTSAAPYVDVQQEGGIQPQPGPPANDPNVSQYPPYPQYPPPAGPGPYGQPLDALYPSPGYGAAQNPPQQQQQQQIVVVTAGQPQSLLVHHTQTFVAEMTVACCVMWCCNCPFGLVAFILAGQPNKLLQMFN